MKIFLMDFSSEQQIKTASNLQEKDIEILYWTGKKKFFNEAAENKEKFPNTIFHSQTEAVKGIPAKDFCDTNFPPPSTKLIEEMLECESITLTMMTRVDYTNMPLIKKKHLYYKYLSYWDGVLKKLKPDLILFSDVPHICYNFVVYSLAKKYNIRTIFFKITYRADTLILISDYKKSSGKLLEEYKRIENEQHSIDELDKEYKNHHERLINLKLELIPDYKQKLDKDAKSKLSIIPSKEIILKRIFKKKFNFFVLFRSYVKNLLKIRGSRILVLDENDQNNYKNIFFLKKFEKIKENYKKEYLCLQEEVDFNKKYVYFAMQLQPECSTSPSAKFYVDQLLSIKTLSAAIPEDYIVYVKEYTAQWSGKRVNSHLYRYQGYYKELEKLDNVHLLSPEISSFRLIDNSRAVSTASGSVGWEALARSKPALIFGYPWYMYCDGVFQIKSVEDCKKAMAKIENGYKPDAQKVLNYFLALNRVGIKSAHVSSTERFSDLSRSESERNMSKAIIKEIRDIENL